MSRCFAGTTSSRADLRERGVLELEFGRGGETLEIQIEGVEFLDGRYGLEDATHELEDALCVGGDGGYHDCRVCSREGLVV